MHAVQWLIISWLLFIGALALGFRFDVIAGSSSRPLRAVQWLIIWWFLFTETLALSFTADVIAGTGGRHVARNFVLSFSLATTFVVLCLWASWKKRS